MSLIYSPEDDSYLLQEVLKNEIKNKDITCLEVGVGSGIQLETLKEIGIKKENIYGSDVNKEAVQFCKEKGFNCFVSNLFEDVKEKFDLIIFNPPYLPKTKNEDEESELITTGGKEGSELINKFLIEAKKHLNENGKIFLLVSSLTKGINFLDYKKRIVGEKKIFFEKLIVFELVLWFLFLFLWCQGSH